MDNVTVHKLKTATSNFYEVHAQSFSETRQSPWNGWKKVALFLDSLPQKKLRIFDYACGNFRLERFLANAINKDTEFGCFDNCLSLSTNIPDDAQFIECDMIDCLCNNDFEKVLESLPKADCACSFGFMHHIPSYKLRLKFLKHLISSVKPGGYVIVSFWQFMKSETLAKKVHQHTPEAMESLNLKKCDLEENDFFLTWQVSNNAYRYCHHFSNDEIQSYVADLSSLAKLEDQFASDGKTNNLNTYAIFQRLREDI